MSKLIILEGPDGAGKTTLLEQLTGQMPANTRFHHFNRGTGIKKTVGRLYVEAMMPAFLGACDVVMDRSWYSEAPYARAFWKGDDRLGPLQVRMLERIAMHCETVVIRCDPGWDVVAASFQRRKDEEMLKDTTQLRMVYDYYKTMKMSLPCFVYDYRKDQKLDPGDIFTTRAHTQFSQTVGNLDARTLVVGDPCDDHRDQDHFMRLPFCTFSGAGDSLWVTEQFERMEIGEERLFWCDTDCLEDVFKSEWGGGNVLALGPVAGQACMEFGLRAKQMPHPSKWRTEFPEHPYPVEVS